MAKSKGIERRLAKYGIIDMEGIAKAPEALLYKEFGITTEAVVDAVNSLV